MIEQLESWLAEVTGYDAVSLQPNAGSQGELAERREVSRQTVNALETGKYDPSLPLAFRIARLFGLRIEDVFLPGE